MNGLPVSGDWANSFDSLPVAHVAEPPKPPRPPAPLAIVLPFIGPEVPRVIKLLQWIEQLCGKLNRTLYLLPFKGINVADVELQARRAFADVQIIQDSEGVTSDWKQDEKIRDAAGPNSLFRQAAWFFQLKPMLGPWLYLEPDCVPLTKDFDQQLETGYRASGKPFFGASMKSQAGDEYLNGAAIYPRNAITLAPSLAQQTMWEQFPEMEIAFDVVGGREVLRQATLTNLIQLVYRFDGTPFVRNPAAVLFHGDRTGSILGARLSAGGREEVKPTVGSAPPESAKASRSAPKAKASGGSNPPRQAPKRPKRKRGDTKCHPAPAHPAPAAMPKGCVLTADVSNGAETVPSSSAPRAVGTLPAIHETINATATATFPRNMGTSIRVDVIEVLTVGDKIRWGVEFLVNLATNANRDSRIKKRLLRELRKAKLLRR